MDTYEKKYKEALERMRYVVIEPKNENMLQAIKEIVFPELAEPEDEKIKKWLISQLKIKSDGTNSELDIMIDKAIAWLEKQSTPQVRTGLEWVNTIDDACDKRYAEEYAHGEYCHEQSFKWGFQEGVDWLEKQGESMEINPTEFDTRLQSLIGKFDSLPKEELIGSLSFWLNVVQNDGTYREEKQGEHSIYNVPSREVILAIWDLGNEWKELTNGSISTEYGTQLDYIQKHWHESEYYLKEKQSEQKPAEWSEEDEDIRDTIIRDLKRLGGDMVTVKPAYKEEVDWLKSLKYRFAENNEELN